MIKQPDSKLVLLSTKYKKITKILVHSSVPLFRALNESPDSRPTISAGASPLRLFLLTTLTRIARISTNANTIEEIITVQHYTIAPVINHSELPQPHFHRHAANSQFSAGSRHIEISSKPNHSCTKSGHQPKHEPSAPA